MKIVEVRTTDGPNYWSVKRHSLVVMLLDLEEMEDRPTNTLPGFYERLATLLPSLVEHRCSEGERGGFFRRVEMGTWMGHIIEHIALEIQTLGGMETGFGRTREAGRRGLYHVVFSCKDAEAGKYAAAAATRIAAALAEGSDYDLGRDIEQLSLIWKRNKPGPSTSSIIEEAQRRNIPIIRLNEDSLFQLGYGAAQRRIEAAVASTTSHIAVELAKDKSATKTLLSAAGVPVAEGETVHGEEDLMRTVRRLGFPLVIKPIDGNHGRGATLNITDEPSATAAFRLAKMHAGDAICERCVTGSDFRVLVVNYKFVAAARRTPPCVTGNGRNTILELIERVNRDPARGSDHECALTKICVDELTLGLLARRGYRLDTVLPEGEDVLLKDTANLSTGGSATDVSDSVHPANIALCERIAHLIGLDICGIDIIAPGLWSPLHGNGGVVLEVNAGPGLRMHLNPSHGQSRNVAAPIVDMLFPNGRDGRIPIVGITGTNGKTTTTRLIAEIGKMAGFRVGYTTTDGIYIGDQMIMPGDCTGPGSARMVLKDPGVDLAVLECARGGLLRGGLGFDRCDIAVITNIGEDHLGIRGIDTIQQLARLKGVLAESVSPEGYAILNADDDEVYRIRERLQCHIALFSMTSDNPRIREHVRQGGVAAVFENGQLAVVRNGVIVKIGPVEDMPITFSGQATFNIANALAASLVAYLQGIDIEDIHKALIGFRPGPHSSPGRMNIFEFGDFKVIADYAHNTHGLKAISGFLKAMPATVRVGVIAGVGDRRDEDIKSLGSEAAHIFDEIIIRRDTDLRGRTADELNKLLMEGIRRVDPEKKVILIPEETKAINAVIRTARKGMVATVFVDDIPAALRQLREACTLSTLSLKAMEMA